MRVIEHRLASQPMWVSLSRLAAELGLSDGQCAASTRQYPWGALYRDRKGTWMVCLVPVVFPLCAVRRLLETKQMVERVSRRRTLEASGRLSPWCSAPHLKSVCDVALTKG